MESSGKRVTPDGEECLASTAPVLWGEPGTNGQHSFHQLLHQGTQVVPAELSRSPSRCTPSAATTTCCSRTARAGAGPGLRAQRGGAARGRRRRGADPAPRLPGEPAVDDDPRRRAADAARARHSRGALRAPRADRGRPLGINSFDQWGVELGKELATRLAADLVARRPRPPVRRARRARRSRCCAARAPRAGARSSGRIRFRPRCLRRCPAPSCVSSVGDRVAAGSAKPMPRCRRPRRRWRSGC